MRNPSSTTTSQNSAYSCPWDTTTLPDGAYQVQATATDNAGNPYTTPIQNTTIHNTPPSITLQGPLWEQPQQTLNGTVSDVAVYAADNPDDGSGPGIASVEFKIDGQDPDPNQYLDSQSCPTGGCTVEDTFPVDANQLSPGTHTLQVTAVDTLGNSTQQSWQITTNQGGVSDYSCPSTTPTQTQSGTVASSASATSLLQSTFATVAALASAVTQDGQTILPALDTTSSPATATGTVTPATMSSQQPAYSFGSGSDKTCMSRDTSTADSQPGSSITPSGAPSPVAMLYANTSASVDTVLRPIPTGVESLEQLRDSAAPQTFTWDVALHDGQQLRQLSNGDVAVINGPDTQAPPDPNWTAPSDLADEGPEIAPTVASDNPSWFSSAWSPTLAQITDLNAQLQSADAHATSAYDLTEGQVVSVFSVPWAVDAHGTAVPTSLATQGNQITLTISHQGQGFAYPILADPTASNAKASSRVMFGTSNNDHRVYEDYAKTGLGTGKLHPRFARKLVPWNYNFSVDGHGNYVQDNPAETDQHVAAWIAAVHAQGLQAMLTLDAQKPGKGLLPPPPPPTGGPGSGSYQYAFDLWQAQFPYIHYWGAWNEPDNHRVPTGDPRLSNDTGPQLAAKYWEIAQRRCASKGCTVLAGEFTGEGYYSLPAAPYISIKAFIERYKNEIIAHHTYYRHNPKIFGLHDYGDPLHVKQSSRSAQYGAVLRPTLQLPKALGDPALKRPRVWVIETGVPLRLHGGPTPRLPGNPGLQDAAAHLILGEPNFHNQKGSYRAGDTLVDRASYYTYWGDPASTFDSGMLDIAPPLKDPIDPNMGDAVCPTNHQRTAWYVLAGSYTACAARP